MADDMRTKAYPPLPPKGAGPRIAIVLPTTGDLQLRSLLPDVFQQQLAIHADAAYYPLYARFVVLRKFIVMSSDGDLYTQTVRTTLERKDLPQLLPLPSIAPWDIVKVLDLAQCFAGAVSWEIVRVRWQSGQTSWLPIELLQHHFVNVLQAFYVNSINSWSLRDRIYLQSLRSFQTEVELWLHHDEFRKFYQYLRQRRAMASVAAPPQPPQPQPVVRSSSQQQQQPMLRDEDVKSALKRSLPQQQPARTAPAPPTRAPIQPPLPPPSQPQPQPPLPLPPPQQQQRTLMPQQRVRQQLPLQSRGTAATNHDRSHSQPTATTPASAPVHTNRSAAPATTSNGPTPTPSAAAPTRNERVQTPAAKLGAADRARLPTAAAAAPTKTTVSQPPLSSSSAPRPSHSLSRTTVTTESSTTDAAAAASSASKRFKRLKKQRLVDDSSDSDTDDDLPLDAPPRTRESPTASAAAKRYVGGAVASALGVSPVVVIDDDDEAVEDAANRHASLVIGDIRCVCGAESVGVYTGKWLHCCHDDCGVWEHADCVGVLGNDAVGSRYECSRCSGVACLARRAAAATSRLVEWLFQCCASKNTAQLLTLLREHPDAPARARGWTNPVLQHRTLLMEAARCGLTKAVQYLMHVAKVDVFATDDASLNVLHHAALGGKRRCVLYLLAQEPRLLAHQDRTGRTPFHCLLASATLNDVCVDLLAHDASLAATGDLATNAPIHFACRALTAATPELCRVLMQHQPQTVTERSSDGYVPFLLLCRAAATTTLSTTAAAASVKTVARVMLDIDVLGSFLDARALNGWSCVHFAAAAGNHELLTFLGQHESVDAHATTVDDSNETALHIAARHGHALCVRALLHLGLHVTAKDADGAIPMLRADDAACVLEFLSYKLTKQLSRLHRMVSKFEQQDVVRRWQRCVVRDPTCFDVFNDWCQRDLERIQRMRGLFLTTPHMLRLDNKLDYLETLVFPTLRASAADAPTQRCGIQFNFTAADGAYWQQFVRMAQALEPDAFRSPMQFAIDAQVDTASALAKLVSSLAAANPGLLSTSDDRASSASHLEHSELSDAALRAQLLDFYLFGELVAHVVLYRVALSGVLDLSTRFLQCVLRESRSDPQWLLQAQSFAGGFSDVLPDTLALLRVTDFRVLVHGRTDLLDVRAVDWTKALEWTAFGDRSKAAAWWTRLVNDLVIEEQQLVVLMFTETFASARAKLWVRSSGDVRVLQRLARVVPLAKSDDDADDIDVDDTIMPFMDHRARALVLPTYAHYDAFKCAALRWLRSLDTAFQLR